MLEQFPMLLEETLESMERHFIMPLIIDDPPEQFTGKSCGDLWLYFYQYMMEELVAYTFHTGPS